MSKYPLKVGICKQCGDAIIAKNSGCNPPTRGRKFCNKTCQIIWQNKNIPITDRRRKILSDRAKKLMLGRKPKPESIEKQRKTISGSGHWNWQGGRTSLTRKIRNCFEYKLWRNSVFKRDNYTCTWCGIKSSKGVKVILNADHIKQFSVLIKENGIMTFEEAVNCSNLWDINNGRTLCLDCHKQTDTFANK